MAKKKADSKYLDVVTNFSQSEAEALSGEQSEKGETALSQHDIEKLIVTVRGQQVMLDRDLAFAYQVEVKQMNRQVKRNIERFPEDFMFQLTREEYNSLKCQNGTSNTRGGDRVLSLLSKRGEGIPATIHTRYSEPFLTDLEKHNEQYSAIKFVQLSHKNHDRFLIIDDKAYLLGASVKDIGAGLCAVTELAASPETILAMLK